MKKILISALATLSVSAFASMMAPLEHQMGGGNPPPKPPTFAEMDANGDGLLSQSEVKGPLSQDFSRFDQDGDGFLSESELPAPPDHGPNDNGRHGQNMGGGRGHGNEQGNQSVVY